MSFVGSKGGAGVYQRVISWMAPHDVYCEPFAGLAAVFRAKRLARRSILIDLDPGTLDRIGGAARWPGVETIVGDGIEWLVRFRAPADTDVQVYCDPPYLCETRRDPDRQYYAHDWTIDDHERFLDAVVGASSSTRVLISGYWSELYANRLTAWHTDRFPAVTRGGPSEEWLWANYPRPARLHDYRYVGDDYRERERIRKHQRRRCRILRKMPELERRALLAALADEFRDELMEYLDVVIDADVDEDPTAADVGAGSRRVTRRRRTG